MLQSPQIDGTPEAALLHFRELLRFPAGISKEFGEAFGLLNPEWQEATPQLMLELWLVSGGPNADLSLVAAQLAKLAAKPLKHYTEYKKWPRPPLFDLSAIQSSDSVAQTHEQRSIETPLTLRDAVAPKYISADARVSSNPLWVLYCRVLSACAAAALDGTLVCSPSTIHAAFRQRVQAVRQLEERWLASAQENAESENGTKYQDRWQQAFLQVHAALLQKPIGPADWFAGPNQLEKFNRYFRKTFGNVGHDVGRRESLEQAAVVRLGHNSAVPNKSPSNGRTQIEALLERWQSLLQQDLPDWLSAVSVPPPEFHLLFTTSLLERLHRKSARTSTLQLNLADLMSESSSSPPCTAAAAALSHYGPGLSTLTKWCECQPWQTWQPPADWDTFLRSLRMLPAESFGIPAKTHEILQQKAVLAVELRLFQILLVLRLQDLEWNKIHRVLKAEDSPAADFVNHWRSIAEDYREFALPTDFLPLRPLADIVGGQPNNLRYWFERRREVFLVDLPAS